MVPILFEKIDKEKWFKIPNVDSFPPFFMTLVSDSNHWLFISSNGGLTAGRKNSDLALFPYYTDDKITRSKENTGTKTVFRLGHNGETVIWEPFSDRCPGKYSVERNLFKNRYGNKIRFQEINHDLKLSFTYEWNTSNEFGFVRKAELTNLDSQSVQVKVLDGFQNILPYGVGSDLQSKQSNLVDAYKRSELIAEKGIGIYALSAIIVDRAEPSEALKANIVWSHGFDNPVYLLTSKQLDAFREGQDLSEETDVKAEKGSYLVSANIDLPGKSVSKTWYTVANVNQDQSDILQLESDLNKPDELISRVEADIEKGTVNLIRLVSSADGIQKTADPVKDTRHFANVLFNIMRGGIFDQDYLIEVNDLLAHLKNTNKELYKSHADKFESFNDTVDLSDLKAEVKKIQDPDLERIVTEYLPLKFSRRHGDPSRPWNKFSIETRSEKDGSKILNYQGNWRDIFQNWEALAHSYPYYMEGMISRFLNASTFDGYNPYRITKDGFDWEVIEPDDPWSYIGYWGDHQIIYLLKFLEFQFDHDPDGFDEILKKERLVYANVPYRIKPYAEILKNPKDTIEFDLDLDKKIRQDRSIQGSDAAILRDASNKIYHVNFLEKIMASLLAKLSNFVPEGGIWMNTQRPEWNDANNALVGNGLSMVTLYYLHRFVKFFLQVTEEKDTWEFQLSAELHNFYLKLKEVFINHQILLDGAIENTERKKIVDQLGLAASEYREEIYQNTFSGNKELISYADFRDFLALVKGYLEHSIRSNKRSDKLYHSYNLLEIKPDKMEVSYLSEMLEGQVAVLSSKLLKAEEAVDVLGALRKSALYRPDQNSYILYPNKNLPGFLQKNQIPSKRIEESKLLTQLLRLGELSIIKQDVKGNYHFNGNFRNKNDLQIALNELKQTQYKDLVEKEEEFIQEVFEEVFNHKSFTGRSGTFFAYEGLGSIYWHMVSKLHLAVAETYESAQASETNSEMLEKLEKHFYEIGEGIGIHKDPEVYGAFPTDPYSHTPAHRGAQQPGMTGQVKEDILVRYKELGVDVSDGRISFNPTLLRKSEFLERGGQMELVDLQSEHFTVELEDASLAFSICQVPVVYEMAKRNEITVKYRNGNSVKVEGLELDRDISVEIFSRNKEIEIIKVHLNYNR
jgi:hypothetical protein